MKECKVVSLLASLEIYWDFVLRDGGVCKVLTPQFSAGLAFGSSLRSKLYNLNSIVLGEETSDVYSHILIAVSR